MKIAMWNLKVAQVKDQSYPGVSLLPLGYEWVPEEREAMLAMEEAVFAEMRAWGD